MKFKLIITTVFIFCLIQAKAVQPAEHSDSLLLTLQGVIDTDSLLESTAAKSKASNQITKPKAPALSTNHKTDIKHIDLSTEKQAFDSLINAKSIAEKKLEEQHKSASNLQPIHIDTLILSANPFFIDLVYENLPLNFNWNVSTDFRKLAYGKSASGLLQNAYEPAKTQTPEQFISNLRTEARTDINRKAIHLYAFRYDELPDPTTNKNQKIKGKALEKIKFVNEDDILNTRNRKIYIREARISPWVHKASSLLQFSENAVSSNWYQGGNGNVAVLGILSGQLSYDNKKSIQWDNTGEWRMGFNSVAGDTIHAFSTNDDVFKINSKLGIKAGGNWFYSGSVDFSTQLFHSYKGINSTEMKAAFLTPIRVNVGVGLDYKYKKIFSLMLSPVSYKYIYLNDNKNIDPNLFGIKDGKNELKEIGSSFKAIFSYALTREIQFDSNLSFYTNYQKVEIDWEMVGNFTINRFLSTRISFNPRYDNTVIEKEGEHAKLQYKQLLSIGFSHKFR